MPIDNNLLTNNYRLISIDRLIYDHWFSSIGHATVQPGSRYDMGGNDIAGNYQF